MNLEIEKIKDGTFTVRIRAKGRITFSNSGLNTKQAAYKKLCGLYKAILSDFVKMDCVLKNGKSIEVYYNNDCHPVNSSRIVFFEVPVKEINC